MNWKSINLLPKELINEDVLLRIELRQSGDIIYAIGSISELGDVYAYGSIYSDGKYLRELNGFISRDFYKCVWYVDPREIKL